MKKRNPAQILLAELLNLPWRKNTTEEYDVIFSAVETELLKNDFSESVSEAQKWIEDGLCDGEFLFSVFGECDEKEEERNIKAVDEISDDLEMAGFRIERRRNNAKLLRTQKRDVSRRLAFIGFCMGMKINEIVSSVREEKIIDIYKKAAQIFAPPRRQRIQRWRKAR